MSTEMGKRSREKEGKGKRRRGEERWKWRFISKRSRGIREREKKRREREMFVHISLLWEDLHPFEMQVCRLAGTAGLYYFLFGQRSIEKIRKIIPLLCIGSISLSAFLFSPCIFSFFCCHSPSPSTLECQPKLHWRINHPRFVLIPSAWPRSSRVCTFIGARVSSPTCKNINTSPRSLLLIDGD